jgi:hypothetical protein
VSRGERIGVVFGFITLAQLLVAFVPSGELPQWIKAIQSFLPIGIIVCLVIAIVAAFYSEERAARLRAFRARPNKWRLRKPWERVNSKPRNHALSDQRASTTLPAISVGAALPAKRASSLVSVPGAIKPTANTTGDTNSLTLTLLWNADLGKLTEVSHSSGIRDAIVEDDMLMRSFSQTVTLSMGRSYTVSIAFDDRRSIFDASIVNPGSQYLYQGWVKCRVISSDLGIMQLQLEIGPSSRSIELKFARHQDRAAERQS